MKSAKSIRRRVRQVAHSAAGAGAPKRSKELRARAIIAVLRGFVRCPGAAMRPRGKASVRGACRPSRSRAEILLLFAYAKVVPNVRACRVSFVDTEGITHTAQVTAASLFEAAALGLATFRRCCLMDATPGPTTQITVSVDPPSTVHQIPMRKLTSWLTTGGKSPNEQAVKVRLGEMLAVP